MTSRTLTVPARLLGGLLALVLAGTLAVLGAPAALAHDVLVSTSPQDGSTVAATPDKVTLTFDNPAIATGTVIQVKGPGGEVQTGKPQLVDDTVSQAIAPGAPAGRYTVLWRITSIDGHPVSGTLSFTSSAKGAGTPVATTQAASGSASPGASGQATPGTSFTPPDPGARNIWSSKAGLVIIIVACLALLAIVGGVVSARRTSGGSTRGGLDDDDE